MRRADGEPHARPRGVGGCTDTNEFNFLQWKFISALGVTYRGQSGRFDTVPRWPVWPPRRTGSDDQRLVDIRNADVVLVMGGNPARTTPAGSMGGGGQEDPQRQAGGGGSRFTRTGPSLTSTRRAGGQHRVPEGLIRYGSRPADMRLHPDPHRRPVHRRREVAFDDGLFSGFDPEKAGYDKSAWRTSPIQRPTGTRATRR